VQQILPVESGIRDMKLFGVVFDFQEQLSAALLCMLQFGHDFIGWGGWSYYYDIGVL
jgi:hypothetical protein